MPFYDPADRPIEPPNDELATPHLQESDIPSDSFVSEVLKYVPPTLSAGILVPATLNVDNHHHHHHHRHHHQHNHHQFIYSWLYL